jgi:hypothetical protein
LHMQLSICAVTLLLATCLATRLLLTALRCVQALLITTAHIVLLRDAVAYAMSSYVLFAN